MKKYLKNIVESDKSRSGRLFDIFIQILIVLSLISFSLETTPSLDSRLIDFLKKFEFISIIIFTLEYLIRIYVSDKRLSYIFSFYGFIDFIAIAPFYLSGTIDLRSLRVVRLLRILRLFKLFRFNESLILLTRAFSIVKREMIIFSFIAMIVLYTSSVGIYFFENPEQPEQFSSIFACMWWAISTMTTVGYGDMVPVTVGGKIFTSLISFIGIGVVSIPTALLASSLTGLLQINKDDLK
jgi:voltage-gated potassium channel